MFALIAVAALTIGIPAIASAQTGAGSGTLSAQGSGVAVVSGSGAVNVTGSGVLYIKDSDGHTQIRVDATTGRHRHIGSWHVYYGFEGSVAVHGSDFTVKFVGDRIDLQARGTGRFLLRGEGHYSTNSVEGTWDGRWHELPID